MKIRLIIPLVFLSGLLTACGFHLRGAGTDLDGAKVWLLSDSPNASFERTLKQRLAYQGAQLVQSAEASEMQLAIVDYNTEKRTVARDSFGRASELELIFTLKYQLLTPDTITEGEPQTQTLNSRREFAYQRTLESGQENEQQRLIDDMHQDVIGRLLLQMATTHHLNPIQ
ncbi:LPS-assembly lipoprotein LptE [Kangiella sediminilitoris]|uniref:LPS-assembly lipoprotein LptE n=1 Tax=Kangiella sediminilitoris TaxID=1144748 RepID=A0A1B3BDE2_9GAMM|nr:LPS assembly lipoprotein LptE [Kangiella sediminilitoris]AOE50788.1 LPS-assembly lipoprotein LptE [Kangiella sediminilitoris]